MSRPGMPGDTGGLRLADHTTLRVGGPARAFIEATTADDLVAAVRKADQAGEPVFILSGGSNVLVGDDGFPGTVIHVASRGVTVETADGVRLRVQAGEPWDDLVARTVAEGWSGLEALSGVPGLAGATPVQNVGAYGAEVAASIHEVRAYDRRTGRVRVFPGADGGFGYRDSRFKRSRTSAEASGRYVVLEVTFALVADDRSAPVAYAELARTLGIAVGERAGLADVRDAVLALRRGKGMVLDEADTDTWSAGSFFTNPLLDGAAAESLPAEAPRFPQADGRVKTSAAWLIEHAGLGRGWGIPVRARAERPAVIVPPGEPMAARLSTKHVLALTNPGQASAADLVALAHGVEHAVRDRFGIDLEPEVVLVGTAWDA